MKIVLSMKIDERSRRNDCNMTYKLEITDASVEEEHRRMAKPRVGLQIINYGALACAG
jgi:hypothetical protein